MVASAFKWRASMLRKAIGIMLEGSPMASVSDIYASPLVLALSRTSKLRTFWNELKADKDAGTYIPQARLDPSYIPATTFSAAILQGIMSKGREPVDPSPEAVIQEIKKQLSEHPAGSHYAHLDALASVLSTTLATQGPSIQAVRLAIEKWFNDSMDRVSGWYKRQTQVRLLIIGLLLGFGCNFDTIAIARWLWQGDAARQSVIAVATEYAKSTPRPVDTGVEGTQTDGKAKAPQIPASLARIVEIDRQTAALQYPIGWPRRDEQNNSFWQYLFGALLTAVAVSMGSTFWFDALTSLIKLRGAGPKPGARAS
jgi:hypothetical protein